MRPAVPQFVEKFSMTTANTQESATGVGSDALLAIPDFSQLPVMPEHAEIVELTKRFTRISDQSDIAEEPDAVIVSCWFIVEQQSFRFAVSDDRQDASWLCFQFAKALSKALTQFRDR